jgi:predicted ChrR family anti-sigma factor
MSAVAKSRDNHLTLTIGLQRLNYDGTIRLAAEDRPIDALLADYAAQTLGGPLAALVVAHLQIKPDNRCYVAALEAAHGVFLEEIKPVPLAGRDRRLVNIFASTAPEPPTVAPVRRATDAGAVLPPALRHLAGCDYAELSWRSRAPGLKESMLTQDASWTAGFVSAQPGGRLPLLCGERLAVALVLSGEASDRRGTYQRGDIAFAGRNAEDAPVVDGDADCACFIVTEGRAAKPAGSFSRIFQRMMVG